MFIKHLRIWHAVSSASKHHSIIASSKVTEQAESRWTLIVERFRVACILHRENRDAESRQIIKGELPVLIKSWIKLLPTSLKEDAKADLRDMFTKEQSLVEQGMRLQNVFRETLVQQIIPQVEEQVAAKYRAIYLREQQKRAHDLEAVRKRTWVKLSSPESNSLESSQERRVSINDVRSMIDAVQKNDPQLIASSMLPLDQIVGTLDRARVDTILSES